LEASEQSIDSLPASPPICPTCGNGASDKFCSACGEQMLREPDYSLRGLLGETLNVVTNLESNIFRSFWLLIRRPGLLTVEYFAGRRKHYLKPLQLFIFCNVIFFFFQAFAGFNSLRTPLMVHLYQMPHSQFARRKVSEVLKSRNVTFDEYRASFDSTIETQAKTLVFLMIPMFAAGLTILYFRAREYVVKHIVFATHFFCFFLLWLSAMYLVARTAMQLASRITGTSYRSSDLVMTSILLSGSLIYLVLATRRTYLQSWLSTLLKSAAMIGVLMVVVQLYRFVLFFTTFYSV
jgi:hypothetical protein